MYANKRLFPIFTDLKILEYGRKDFREKVLENIAISAGESEICATLYQKHQIDVSSYNSYCGNRHHISGRHFDCNGLTEKPGQLQF